jgi:hypothetical protein
MWNTDLRQMQQFYEKQFLLLTQEKGKVEKGT